MSNVSARVQHRPVRPADTTATAVDCILFSVNPSLIMHEAAPQLRILYFPVRDSGPCRHSFLTALSTIFMYPSTRNPPFYGGAEGVMYC